MDTTSWINQDVLKLSVEQWLLLIANYSIFDENALEMLDFVYSQPNHESSATEIGIALNGVPQQKITALNRGISKKIYNKYNREAPPNSVGGKRYWNVIFDGNPVCEKNKSGFFIWKLRPNLIEAIKRKNGCL